MSKHLAIMITAALADRRRFAVSVCLALWVISLAGAEPIKVTAAALFKNKALLVVNGKRRLLKVGKVSPEGVKLVSATSETAVIEVDNQELTLHLDGKIVSSYVRGIAAKTLQLYPDSRGHYFVDGLINGNGMRFLIDTGATSVAINKNAARRMGLLYRVDGEPTRVATASGIVAAYHVVFDEVQIRHLKLKRVEGVVVDGSYPSEALLGQSFLNRLNMRRVGQMLELQER